jgi:hypothetical protein
MCGQLVVLPGPSRNGVADNEPARTRYRRGNDDLASPEPVRVQGIGSGSKQRAGRRHDRHVKAEGIAAEEIGNGSRQPRECKSCGTQNSEPAKHAGQKSNQQPDATQEEKRRCRPGWKSKIAKFRQIRGGLGNERNSNRRPHQ